jgi:hypothetical protein
MVAAFIDGVTGFRCEAAKVRLTSFGEDNIFSLKGF